jgi:hypothetical protein
MPHLLLGQDPDACASDGLDVGRQALLDPGIGGIHFRETEVHQLVSQHPVGPEVGLGGPRTQSDADERPAAAMGRAAPDSPAAAEYDAETDAGHREPAVVCGDGAGRLLDPPPKRLRRQRRRAQGHEVDESAIDLNSVGPRDARARCAAPGESQSKDQRQGRHAGPVSGRSPSAAALQALVPGRAPPAPA